MAPAPRTPSPSGMPDPHPMPARSGIGASRMRPVRRARMLAAVAVAGTAALLAACSSAAPGQSTAPTAPSTTVEGPAPVPIDDERLANPTVGDLVAADGYALRWNLAGQSVAFFLGGSGGGGGCIPQPHAIELDQAAGELHLRFDGPDPAMACTADFRIHGWELALPEPLDAARVWPVLLHDLQEPGSTIETQLGPDDIITSGATADPQPSVVPGVPPEGAGTPTPVAPDALPDVWGMVAGNQPPIAVRWVEPGTTLAVFLIASGTEPCVPTPQSAWQTGIGQVEVAFSAPTGDIDCSADGHPYGWTFTLPAPIPASTGVEVTVTGIDAEGPPAVVSLAQTDTIDLP